MGRRDHQPQPQLIDDVTSVCGTFSHGFDASGLNLMSGKGIAFLPAILGKAGID